MIINKDYWAHYYSNKDNRLSYPSDFAIFVRNNYFSPNSIIIDVGCGNGRDSSYFRAEGFEVKSLDAIYQPHLINFKQCDLKDYDYCANIIYCRWVIHSIDEGTEDLFFKKLANDMVPDSILCIECRSDKDVIQEESHYRRLINREALHKKLNNFGFSIIYSDEKRGWSTVRNDDPLLIRMIGKK